MAETLLYVVIGVVAGVGLRTEQIPPIEYEIGYTFELPCGEHAGHINTITGSRLTWLYEITGDNGEIIEVDSVQIQQALDTIRILQLFPE